LLASNVPNARDGVTVLALIKSGATTTVVEVDKGINALIVTADEAGNRTSREALRARGNIARAVLALLSGEAFVVARIPIATIRIVIIPIVFIPIVIALIGLVIVTRFIRWSGWVGRVGRGWRVAAERIVGPLPVVVALRRRGIVRW